MKHVTAVVLKGYPRLSETFIAQELLGLERAGHKLIFFSMRHPTDQKTHPIHQEIKAQVLYLPEYLHVEPMRVLAALAKVIWRPGFWRASAAWCRDIVKEPTWNRVRRFGQGCVLAAEVPPGVTRLYSHFIHTPAAVTRYASLMSGLPWMCSAHAKDIWTSPDWDLKRSLVSAQWVATCTGIGHAHLQLLSDDPKRVHLIYHGLDLVRFPRFAGQRALLDGQNPEQPVQLLSVGRAVEKKGFDTLLTALALLPSGLHWRWTHIGGGAKLADLRQQATELGISDNIMWLGPMDQTSVLDHYRRADLFALPCRVAADGDRDGLPNVLVEAQSQALATIATPVSGIPELIENERNGILVPPDQPEELAAAMARLIESPTERIALGVAGETIVRQGFDFNRGIAALDKLFVASGLTQAANADEPSCTPQQGAARSLRP